MQQPPAESHPEAVQYANQMAGIRTRLQRIQSIVARIRESQVQDDGDVELIFVQFRKCTELIALGSLLANKTIYSETYADFATDWRLKRIVDRLRKLNDAIYPVPVSAPVRIGPTHVRVDAATHAFMTEEELVQLYNAAGRILHSRNPFSTDDPTHNISYSVDDWVGRIWGLIRWHYIQQTESSRWMVEVPETGPVHVYPSTPTP